MDHQIHAGSHEYSIILTDQGNIHFYHIHQRESEQGLPGGYRGTIKATRGSLKIHQDCTGLYLSVISPPFQAPSFEMCQGDIERDRSQLNNPQFHLRSEHSLRQSMLSIYEIGTGKMVFSIPQGLVIADAAWSRDGKYLSVGAMANR